MDSSENSMKSMGRRMTQGTLAMLIQRIVEAGVGLLIVPFSLSHLGSEAYGLWALYFAIVTYFNLADMGFSAALNHHFVKAIATGTAKRQREIFSSSLAYLFFLALTIFIIGISGEGLIPKFFIAARKFGSVGIWAWRASILILILGFIGSYARSLFYSTQRFASLSYINSGISLFSAVVTVFVLSKGWHLSGIAAGAVVVAIVRLLLTFSIGARGMKIWSVSILTVKIETIKEIWRFGLRVLVARIAETIYMSFDRLILGWMNLTSLTHYDIGAKSSLMATQTALISLPTIEPVAATLYAQGKREEFSELLRKTSKYVALLAMFILAIIIVQARTLLTLWLGELVAEPVVITFRILASTYLLVSLTAPLRVSARGAGFPGFEAKSSIIQASLNIILSIVLYFKFGFNGVLMGTFIATTIGQTILVILIFRGLKESFADFVTNAWIKPFVSAVFAGVISHFCLKMLFSDLLYNMRTEMIIPILILSTISLTVFVGVSFLTGSLTMDEVKRVVVNLRKKT
jgi:O-antigen/teichoic acid export membrane protein